MILYVKTVTSQMMLLAKKLTSKCTYFLKSIPEDEGSLIPFLYDRSHCL